MQRCLDSARESNDDLELDKIQIGQGTTRALKSLIGILKTSTGIEDK